jgi:ABC-type sugar transport system substrate-binding protein
MRSLVALNLKTASSIIAASRSLAAGASHGVVSADFYTLVPSLAVSAAKELQRYVRQTSQFVKNTQQAVVSAARKQERY